jgi:hypothetical protein
MTGQQLKDAAYALCQLRWIAPEETTPSGRYRWEYVADEIQAYLEVRDAIMQVGG